MNTDLGKHNDRDSLARDNDAVGIESQKLNLPLKSEATSAPDLAKKHRLLKPFRQGTLDSYCGIYAIANAINRAKPHCLDDETACVLFLIMIETATKIHGAPDFCERGLDEVELRHIAKAAVRNMRKIGHSLEIVTLKRAIPCIPYKRKNKLIWFENAAKTCGLSVIVYVEKPSYRHWSVLKTTERNHLKLFDSDDMRSARYEECDPVLVLRVK